MVNSRDVDGLTALERCLRSNNQQMGFYLLKVVINPLLKEGNKLVDQMAVIFSGDLGKRILGNF